MQKKNSSTNIDSLDEKVSINAKNTTEAPTRVEKTDKKPSSTKGRSEKARSDKKRKKNQQSAAADKRSDGGAFKYLSGLLFAKMMRGGASELRANAEEVNRLNVFPVPDGDTGDNMSMTIDSGVAALERVESDDLGEVMNLASRGMLLGARGNSGVILSQFFAGVASGFEHSDKADPAAVGRALERGVEQAYASVMTPTEGTILTVAREAVEYAVSRITDRSTVSSLFSDLVREMKRSVKRTPERLAALREAGVVDSGGAGLFYIMDGINRVLNGEKIETEPTRVENLRKNASFTATFDADSEMPYGYCTELLVQLMRRKCDIDNFDVASLKEYLAQLGDSIVAFKTESIVKIHVHTRTPDRVIAHALTFGELISVKIENMSLEHSEIALGEPDANKKPKKRYAVVAVTNGAGIDAIYRELGCDATVSGGQTQNPSTRDFLDAFSEIDAEHIFVLPNNSNIIMAANQAAEINTGAAVHVIPTRSVGVGYAVLSTFNFDADTPEEILAAAENTIASVVCASVTTAVRDTEIGGLAIRCGDTIGIIDKEIAIAEPSRIKATCALIDRLLSGGNRFMLTVLAGRDTEEDERGAIEGYIASHYPEVEYYLIDAGQDVYPYAFLAE